MSDRTVRRFVEGLLRGQPTERARPDDFEAEQMKTAIELRAARLGSDAPARGVRDRPASPARRRDGRRTDARYPSPVGSASPPGRHRRLGRGGLGGRRSSSRPQPARSEREARRPRRPPRVSSNPTPEHGGPSARVSTFLTAEPSRSTWVRSTGSFTALTPSWRRCPESARIRDANCGWTRPRADCAARAIRRRSLWRAPPSRIKCRSRHRRCRSSRCAKSTV